MTLTPVRLCWVGGEDFHQNPEDFHVAFDPHSPEAFYQQLDFSNLALNARWASWVYDNPGVDTDGDGYRGKVRVCEGSPSDTTSVDSLWYEGDGVPDFRGAGPPPAPRVRVIPSVSQLTIRFNGFYSETTRDVFTNRIDFEGYRVYSALDDRPSSFSVVRSYDRLNYSRITWRSEAGHEGWLPDEVPYTLEELRQMYGDPNFNPLDHPLADPVDLDGLMAYFEPQDFNQSDLTSPDGIRKVYPDAADPGADSALWQNEDLVYDYGQPLPKYYEYEFVLNNLLPTIPYYVAVTAFDHGSPKSGLKSLESKPENNFIAEFAHFSADSVGTGQLDVYVVPNPYRLDGDYLEHGFENRMRHVLDPERSRRVHFFNLPNVCDIHIFSLDGDLIRRWHHAYPEGGPGSMHDSWDLITRNMQSVVSGLYYWLVESEERTQIGRLAIIK